MGFRLRRHEDQTGLGSARCDTLHGPGRAGPVVLDAAEQAIGPGAQFGNTCAIQVHPGQQAQVLHYEQGIYPLPRDRDVMLTALWALDDFTAANGATRIVPGSHLRHPRDWLMNNPSNEPGPSPAAD